MKAEVIEVTELSLEMALNKLNWKLEIEQPVQASGVTVFKEGDVIHLMVTIVK